MQTENCKLHESIVINHQFTITILEIKSSRVKLGVQTPKGIHVHRKELHERIQNERAGNKE